MTEIFCRFGRFAWICIFSIMEETSPIVAVRFASPIIDFLLTMLLQGIGAIAALHHFRRPDITIGETVIIVRLPIIVML